MAEAEREKMEESEREMIWRPKCVEYMSTLSADESIALNKFKLTIGANAAPVEVETLAGAATTARAAKPRIMVPPMHYDLRMASAQTVYDHINELTKHSVDASNYLESIKPMMFAQTQPLVFGYIPAPPNASITQQVIGLNGYYLKMTTTLCGIYYIWHDTANNAFLFWGSSTFKVVKALNAIRWRIFKQMEMYTRPAEQQQAEQHQAEQQQAEKHRYQLHEQDTGRVYSIDDEAETDDDMPALISCGSSPDYEHTEQC
jgi:hypothetical protein